LDLEYAGHGWERSIFLLVLSRVPANHFLSVLFLLWLSPQPWHEQPIFKWRFSLLLETPGV